RIEPEVIADHVGGRVVALLDHKRREVAPRVHLAGAFELDSAGAVVLQVAGRNRSRRIQIDLVRRGPAVEVHYQFKLVDAGGAVLAVRVRAERGSGGQIDGRDSVVSGASGKVRVELSLILGGELRIDGKLRRICRLWRHLRRAGYSHCSSRGGCGR